MTNSKPQLLSEKINKGVQKAIEDAIEEHRRKNQSIAVWKNGKVVIIPPEEIPFHQNKIKNQAN